MNDLTTQIVSGAVTGFVGAAVGFWAAYLLAGIQRRRDAEDAAARSRAALIHAAKVPLEIILHEIDAGQLLYLTRDVSEGMIRRLREVIRELGDEPLILEAERAVAPLRELAGGSDYKASGQKARPLVEAMLRRLDGLEPKTRVK